jgi:hypothetical protein
MWRWLQAVVDWFRRPSLIQLSLQPPDTTGASRNRRGFDPPKRPLDPDSRVRAPKWHGPAGRSSSIAVDEPVDDENVAAVGALASDAKRARVPDHIERETARRTFRNLRTGRAASDPSATSVSVAGSGTVAVGAAVTFTAND